MRALLIDDEQLILDGMTAYLQLSWPDLTLDQAQSADAAIRLAATVPYAVMLLDWCLVGQDGAREDGHALIQALREAQAPSDAAPIVLVSGADPDLCSLQVHKHGLAGFVPKSAGGAALRQALQAALDGSIFTPSAISMKRARAVSKGAAETAVADVETLRQRFPDLTDRQAAVLAIMARGASNKEIARELGVSLNTVRSHVCGVLSVIGARRRGEAVAVAAAGSSSALLP